jgi:hypothetical protein
MSLKEKLIEKAEDLLDDKAEGWLDKLLEEGRDLATEHEGTLGEDGKKAADDALDLLTENKQPFLRLGKLGFAHLVAMWEDDDKAEARRHYLATEATFEERRAAMQAAGDAAAKDRDERIAAWEAVEDVLKKVGTLGLKFVINLAAKGVGLPISL